MLKSAVSERAVVGIDLGGTNVRAGCFFESGAPAGPDFSIPSRAQEGQSHIFDAIVEVVNQAVGAATVKPDAVGLAIPGFVDAHEGLVRWSPNFGETVQGVFRSWRDVPVRRPLESRLGLPVFMGNDANLAALGEYRFGSGKNQAKCLVMLTIGTGIGGGVVLSPYSVQGDARGPLLLLGGNQGGAELGHAIILDGGLDCNAGTYGAVEAYCPRDAIVTRAIHRIRRGRRTQLTDVVEGDLSKITPKMIADAADKGDEMCAEVYEETGRYLGVTIGSFINVFAPDVFALGGSISLAGELLLAPARKAARNVAIPALYDDCHITVAEQIDDAGMLGAVALALEAGKSA